MTRTQAGTALDERWAAFIQGGVSIVAASRDSHNIPVLCRALGCRVSTDRLKVTLLMASSQAASIIAAVQVSRAIAAVFSQPSTHVSLQLKGSDAVVGAARTAERQILSSYVDAFVAETTPLGYPADVIRAVMWADPADLVTVRFTPASAFHQTPGPRAGERLQ